jgi:hypothetical protein
MSALPPLEMDQIINIIYALYYFVREIIADFFELTIFKNNPDIALLYGDAFTILISLTAVYLILELFTVAKKFVRYLLIIGWVLLIISILAGMV